MALADAYMMMGIETRDQTINELAAKVSLKDDVIEKMNTEFDKSLDELQETISEKDSEISRLQSQVFSERDRCYMKDQEHESNIRELKRRFAAAIASFPQGCYAGKWEFAEYAEVEDYMPKRTMKMELTIEVPFDPQYRGSDVIEAFEDMTGNYDSVSTVTIENYDWEERD